jgi:hypothetical protein
MLASITFNMYECNGTPGLVIKSNKDLVQGLYINPNSLVQGNYEYTFSVVPDSVLTFYITGKDHKYDTEIDENNNIIKDKHIKIQELVLGHICLDFSRLQSTKFNPYLGINEKKHSIEIPSLDRWPDWYLTIEQSCQ